MRKSAQIFQIKVQRSSAPNNTQAMRCTSSHAHTQCHHFTDKHGRTVRITNCKASSNKMCESKFLWVSLNLLSLRPERHPSGESSSQSLFPGKGFQQTGQKAKQNPLKKNHINEQYAIKQTLPKSQVQKVMNSKR